MTGDGRPKAIEKSLSFCAVGRLLGSSTGGGRQIVRAGIILYMRSEQEGAPGPAGSAVDALRERNKERERERERAVGNHLDGGSGTAKW